MKNRNHFCVTAYLILIALFWYGCAATNEGINGDRSFLNQKVDAMEVSPDFSKDVPLKVAILPFENLTGKAEAFDIVRRSFFNHFSSKKYQDIELHKVDFTLRKKGLYENQLFLKQSFMLESARC